MVETVALEHLPSKILQNITGHPKLIEIKGDDVEYSTISKNIEIKTLHSFNGTSDNILITGLDRLLFANTYDMVKIYDNLNMTELMAIISVIFEKISIFKFEEDISIFHIDKILGDTTNLVKISELPKLEIDYIISSKSPIIFNSSDDKIQCVSSGISINRLTELSIRELLIKELNSSFEIIKIADNSAVDIGGILRSLNQYSTVLKYDKRNRLIAIKLKKIADIEYELAKCKIGHIIRNLNTFDRTNWLLSTFR